MKNKKFIWVVCLGVLVGLGLFNIGVANADSQTIQLTETVAPQTKVASNKMPVVGATWRFYDVSANAQDYLKNHGSHLETTEGATMLEEHLVSLNAKHRLNKNLLATSKTNSEGQVQLTVDTDKHQAILIENTKTVKNVSLSDPLALMLPISDDNGLKAGVVKIYPKVEMVVKNKPTAPKENTKNPQNLNDKKEKRKQRTVTPAKKPQDTVLSTMAQTGAVAKQHWQWIIVGIVLLLTAGYWHIKRYKLRGGQNREAN